MKINDEFKNYFIKSITEGVDSEWMSKDRGLEHFKDSLLIYIKDKYEKDDFVLDAFEEETFGVVDDKYCYICVKFSPKKIFIFPGDKDGFFQDPVLCMSFAFDVLKFYDKYKNKDEKSIMPRKEEDSSDDYDFEWI